MRFNSFVSCKVVFDLHFIYQVVNNLVVDKLFPFPKVNDLAVIEE